MAYDILDVIPHDKPMSLLDNILVHNEEMLTALVSITEQSQFFEPESGVPSWVGIEYMGQAVAAYAGALARDKGEAVKIGFLVSCRRYEPSCSYFPPGIQLEVSAKPITENTTGLQVFDCTINGDNIHAQANLNVFLPKDVDAFLNGDA